MGQNGTTPFSQMQMDWVIQTVLNIQQTIHCAYRHSIEIRNHAEEATPTQFLGIPSLPVSTKGRANPTYAVGSGESGPPETSGTGSLMEHFDESMLPSSGQYGYDFSDPINGGDLGQDFLQMDTPNEAYLAMLPAEQNLDGNGNS